MDIDEITDEIIEESGYVETATETGYPRYSETEAVNAAKALEDVQEVETLQRLQEGESLYEVHYSSIGEDLDRWEENHLIERPSNGDFIKLTRLSQNYIQHYRQKT